MWITADQLKQGLGIAPADTSDEQWLTQVTDAVNALVQAKRPDIPADGATVADYSQVVQGCVELGVKMYRSRGATDDGTGSYDVYAYAARYLDANVSLLLGLDMPVIA